MKNIWKTYKEWNNRRWARIRAKGAWHILLHSMLYGFMWGMYMIVVMSAVFYFLERFRVESWLTLILIYVAGGFIMGLFTWVVNVNESRYEKMKEMEAQSHR